jgi:hypothetical protein
MNRLCSLDRKSAVVTGAAMAEPEGDAAERAK